MSDSDKKMMSQSVKHKKVDVVANGVDVDHFNKVKPQKPSKPTILFVGNFKWLPNKDAAKFLVTRIWPTIKSQIPQARLWIVGRNPTSDILSLKKQGSITITGDIDDIRSAFSQSHVLLAPIRNGRGTKYKVLEAMASSVPVVTTKLGIEGINAKNSVIVTESANSLANQTIKLLTDQKTATTMAQKAKKIVYDQYNWIAISNELDKIYQQLGGA